RTSRPVSFAEPASPPFNSAAKSESTSASRQSPQARSRTRASGAAAAFPSRRRFTASRSRPATWRSSRPRRLKSSSLASWIFSDIADRPDRSLRPVMGLIVLAQQVAAEVAVEIPPDRVDVVRPVLRVRVFEEEGRALHAVVVRLALLDAAEPGEDDLVEARLL